MRIIFFLLLSFLLAGNAYAASFIFSPAGANVLNGESAKIDVFIDPEGETLYSAIIEIAGDGDFVLKDIDLADGVIALTASSTQYSSEKAFKRTVGYPGGINKQAKLLSFVVMPADDENAIIKSTTNSKLYGAEGEIAGVPTVSVAVSAHKRQTVPIAGPKADTAQVGNSIFGATSSAAGGTSVLPLFDSKNSAQVAGVLGAFYETDIYKGKLLHFLMAISLFGLLFWLVLLARRR